VNPIREVSELWASLLDQDKEFMGYFDNAVCIVGVAHHESDLHSLHVNILVAKSAR
jgi:hypothetical protein